MASTDSDMTDKGNADRPDVHYIDIDHTWKSKLPPFEVLVHSPQKRTSSVGGAYTVYSVTSVFDSTSDDDNVLIASINEPADVYIRKRDSTATISNVSVTSRLTTPSPPSTNVTVHRRFSQFVFLHNTLTRLFPGIALPPLPAKQYAGRFNDAFVEARRGELQRYLNKIVKHPIARYAEVVTFFLGCESDAVGRTFLIRTL
jgi:sorting nexin-9/18/33